MMNFLQTSQERTVILNDVFKKNKEALEELIKCTEKKCKNKDKKKGKR